jgi:phosphoserine aminotransferase
MSSDIFSRKFDYSKFDCFYAGAQKNMGPAGTTLVIIKEEILNKISNTVPSMLSYKIQAEKDSMFNTPPVFAVYTSMLNMRWVDSKGGIEKLGEHNMHKAMLLYGEIDRNSKFVGFAAKEDRSDMNATFNLVNQNDTEAFDGLCNAAGISGLKGHRSVGGYRASMYNALSIESVDVLVDCMKSLEKNK